MIKANFIGLALDGRTMGRKDSEGEFIRETCKLRLSGAGGDMVCVTASGKVLEGGSDPRKVLEAWNKLPASERQPGAVRIGDRGEIDASRALPTPPPGTLIVKVFYRALAREAGGQLRHATSRDFIGDDQVRAQMAAAYPAAFAREKLNGKVPGDVLELLRRTLAARISEAHPEVMWLTEAEWKSLLPANPRKGDQFAVPEAITRRICLFHLDVNRLYGDPDVGANSIRSAKLTLTVEEASSSRVRLRLNGVALLGAPFDKAEQTGVPGLEGRLLGFLNYDVQKKGFTRFDIVAVSDAYGLLSPGLGHMMYSRPGRSPYGIAFELVRGDSPGDRLPPRGAGPTATLQGYFGTGK